MKNQILLSLADASEDLLLFIELNKGYTRFRASVYLTNPQLKITSSDMENFLSEIQSANIQRRHRIQLGPDLPDSPNCKLEVELLRCGNAALVIQMKSTVHDNDIPKTDFLSVNLWTDIASLDRFSSELKTMAEYSSTAAILYCFENPP